MIFKKSKKYAFCFAIGSAGYGIIELIWRGRTHWTMLIAGGICFVIFSLIEERMREKSLLTKCMLCSLSITLVELIFGIIFNIILKMNVWDYSKIPLNIFGQICPLYSMLWAGLSLLILPIAKKLNEAERCITEARQPGQTEVE